MTSLFQINPVDTEYYRSTIHDFLPQRLIDVHTHVYTAALKKPRKAGTGPKRTVTWPSRVASENPVEDLMESYRLMFPGKHVTPLMFASAGSRSDDFEAANSYVSDCGRAHRFPALLFARPDWTAEQFEQKAVAGGFVGAKVYLSLADERIAKNDIAIFDFLPHHQLQVLNRRGWIVMLHIPRDGRLKDPVNLAQMIEI